MANPFPFVAGEVLTAADMNGIGEAAISFTPTFGSYTRGNGTSVAYYMRVNKLVYVYVEETLGSTSSMGTQPSMTLPVAATRIQAISVTRNRIDDTGSNVFWGTVIPSSASAVQMFADLASGTYVGFANITATVPMTWTTGDKFQIAFVYEAA
jgi:hypothetical protein